MLDDQLQVLTSSALCHLFSQQKLVPITASELLVRVIAFKPPKGLITTAQQPRFKLTDLARFESILESLANTWDGGDLSLIRDNGELTIVDVTLTCQTGPTDSSNSRKRKRVIDEEADSAVGEDNADDTSIEDSPKAWSTLANLGKEQRNIYAMIQKSTAKGKLLAEQVC